MGLRPPFLGLGDCHVARGPDSRASAFCLRPRRFPLVSTSSPQLRALTAESVSCVPVCQRRESESCRRPFSCRPFDRRVVDDPGVQVGTDAPVQKVETGGDGGRQVPPVEEPVGWRPRHDPGAGGGRHRRRRLPGIRSGTRRPGAITGGTSNGSRRGSPSTRWAWWRSRLTNRRTSAASSAPNTSWSARRSERSGGSSAERCDNAVRSAWLLRSIRSWSTSSLVGK